MAHITADRVQETTTTTGTGAITLAGAVAGFRTFASVMAANDTCYYVIQGTTEWEVGVGTFNTTLTRTTVQSSSNAGALVNFSAGTKNVFLTATAFSLVEFDPNSAIPIAAASAEPAAPPAGTGYLYSRNIAGRIFPKWMGPSGFDYPLQPHFGFNNIRKWAGGATTTVATFASTIGSFAYSSAGTITTPTPATTNLLTQTQRSTMSTGTTAGTVTYIRGNNLLFTRGNAANIGGFTINIRIALSALQTGMRAFAGLVDVAANPTNVDPTTASTPGGVGLAINASTGNWNLVHNVTGTARTVIALGASFPVNTTDMLELVLFCGANAANIGYRVTNWSSGATTSGTLSTNIPANTTFLTPSVWLTNNATGAAATMDFIWVEAETDY
jgi:hypothetical protein